LLSVDLDRYDLAILDALQSDGRISNRELADTVGLSPAPCWRRLRALEKQGVISRYTALLDPRLLGLPIVAFAHISMVNHRAGTVSSFIDAITQAPEVLECYMTSGEYDYMLKVVASDMAAYESFLSNVVMQLPSVRTVNTSFALQHKKLSTALPLHSVHLPQR
jgi:DNA-binding Lrp family transcriptional regulator